MEKSIVHLAFKALTCAVAVGLGAACNSPNEGPGGASNDQSDAAIPGVSQDSDASSNVDVAAPDAADGSASVGVGVDGATSDAPGSGVEVGVTTSSPSAALPGIAGFTNVVAQEREDSVGIDFDPVDNAVDYRVYALPNDSDVTQNQDKSVTIKNAVYRCAGVRQTLDVPNNAGNDLTHPDAGQTYANNQYSWQTKVLANPTLGYVYVTPASDRQPVYAVGVHPATYENGWRETRPKVYTTSSATRQTLLSQGGRDDGIVFYVPATSGSSTTTVYHSENLQNSVYSEYYFTSADVAAHASDKTPPAAAFPVLTAAADGTKPLMAILYNAYQVHTELSVGKERYRRAAFQGPGPMWHLEWSGVTKPTTLVVEALASGCPFQGFLSPQALSASPHQTLYTLQQLQQASPTGEVFINGQYTLPGAATSNGTPLLTTTTSSPVVMARSFVQVAPQPHDPNAWDYYQGFSGDGGLGVETPTADQPSCSCSGSMTSPCESGSGFCGYWTSPILNFGFYEADDPNRVPLFTHGQALGQLWHVFDDWGHDVTGTVRFTAPMRPAIPSDPNKYLHVTWSVNAVSTDRRYPQLIVSDQPGPAQDAFANTNANTVLLQTIVGPSVRFEAQAFHGLVNGAPWAVNNQSTHHGLIDYDLWASSSGTGTMQPVQPVFEHVGVDRMTKFDAYLSSGRLLAFVDGTPAGCLQYPSGVSFAMNGSVTVTFGDVLYHEGAPDELVCSNQRVYAFLHANECYETKRHWDDLGFKSGVDAPTWDFTNFPCLPF